MYPIMEKKIGNKEISYSGRLLYRLDRHCNNIKFFLGNHYHTIAFVFLILYILTQLIFVLSIYILQDYIKFIVSIFIIIFLFLISAERIILQFKSRQAQEDKDNAERQYYELKVENRFLIEKNKEVLDKIKFVLGYQKLEKK